MARRDAQKPIGTHAPHDLAHILGSSCRKFLVETLARTYPVVLGFWNLQIT